MVDTEKDKSGCLGEQEVSLYCLPKLKIPKHNENYSTRSLNVALLWYKLVLFAMIST